MKKEVAVEPNEQQQVVIITPEKKKPYAIFLIDRPFDSNQAQEEEEATVALMNCLRYRLHFALNLNDTEVNNENIFDSMLEEEDFAMPNQISEMDSCRSMYDTLLQLIDEFDATGAVEIFRLLLERRTAIPLFIPDSKQHHLNLLRHVSLPGVDNVRLGEDKTLMRVAVISCRQRCESQTSEILKNLFNIKSFHRHDLSNGSVSQNSLLAEIGYGCLLVEGANSGQIQHVIVIHVIGDFLALWPFLQRFADYLLIEDSTVKQGSFCETFLQEFLTANNAETTTGAENSVPGLDAVPFVCVWKPSVGEMRYKMQKVNGSHHHLRIDGQLPGKTLNMLRASVIKAVKDQCTDEKRPTLHEIPILKDNGFSALECVSPLEIQSSIAKSVQNLGQMKTKEFVLQKNFRQQAKHEEAKMEHHTTKEKLREDAKIKNCIDKRRADTYHVQNNSLLQIFLGLLTNKDSCSRVLSLRVLEKELAERGERELVPLSNKVSNLNRSAEELARENNENALESLKRELYSAKIDLIESILNIEHLWRELSHLYTAMEPERRSETIQDIPRLAAQHLLDGFCLELLDGDSNMIHMEWVTDVLYELSSLIGEASRKRIFVLSVMGVQSSGKSTLLNTMFGIQMRTSVGQCTRGVNMQLLAVDGRP
jgi:hypothetical protein